MEKIFRAYYLSPIGTVEITATEEAIVSVLFTEETAQPNAPNLPICLTDCLQQLNQYFAGERKTFELPVASAGTNFQEQVWHQLEKINFGQTLSYYDLSVQLGNLGAIRAVGSANGKNKLLLIRPCHRVIGANGQLVGYAGGLWRKKWLLAHERKINGTHQLTLFG
ncbi:methylated-DNA--[protein]-cysteine S-methyltransferase [Adhaeribacter rhizoryzae]|uniref:Methylated-DNA--protein-cysteine methyltransferase n=1 Tax=Adhaeribacter rhizoryzae TaxID=2607907 RepID=A0A5M6D9Y6_9BACT|nr:methylated-DNA--[protein]-cysteine S-methyltransferase [Adhaeribacter rhizoryzae]KAA5544203.1 methylated-DNA--[protein]-cysteine S-methyltransferase [Adhaeribacter rhizoryzae]